MEADCVPRVSVLHKYLITVDENFVGKPFVISAIFLPHIFESESLLRSRNTSNNPEINLKDLIDHSNSVTVPRMEHSYWDWRARRLAPYSLTYTSWKRKEDRHIFIRLLISDDEEVQVSTIKLHVGSEKMGKPLLTVENTTPRVNTGAYMRVRVQGDLKRMSSAGRVLLLEHYRGDFVFRSLHYAVFSALCYSSLWALSSQERYDALKTTIERERAALDDVVPVRGQEGEEKFSYDKLLVDEFSGTVYTGPSYSQLENIHIWYIS